MAHFVSETGIRNLFSQTDKIKSASFRDLIERDLISFLATGDEALRDRLIRTLEIGVSANRISLGSYRTIISELSVSPEAAALDNSPISVSEEEREEGIVAQGLEEFQKQFPPAHRDAEETKHDAIVLFAFGKSDEINTILAYKATELALRYDVPIFTQEDTAKHIPAESGVRVHVADESEGYLSTLGIVKQFAVRAAREQWQKIIVVASPNHKKRCIRDLKAFAFDVHYARIRKPQTGFKWYLKKDEQLWVRNPIFWWIREIPMRLAPFWIYKKIAG